LIGKAKVYLEKKILASIQRNREIGVLVMIQEALGLIEVIGFVPALEAADACVKSANVKLIGYETVTGGLVTVKIQGDVGAVKASVEAGKMSAARIGTVISTLIIPRPALGIQSFIRTSEDVTEQQVHEQVETLSMSEVAVAKEMIEVAEDPFLPFLTEEEIVNEEVSTPQSEELSQDPTESVNQIPTQSREETNHTCNLCGDPICTREKGMPRNLCIHYKENK
jgi:ethanolamine utilization protein EutM